jgi:hypothetical protein
MTGRSASSRVNTSVPISWSAACSSSHMYGSGSDCGRHAG